MNPLLTFKNSAAKIPEWSCSAGERWLLTAPTGWGKTIWLKQVSLLRDADKSQVAWHGELVTPDTVAKYRQQWRYVTQTPFRFPHSLKTHFDRAAQFLDWDAEKSGAVENGFAAAAKTLGLRHMDLHRTRATEISGGELQAVNLILAALSQPEGLFLDEPTSAMDAVLAHAVEGWWEGHFTGACVWVTHDREQQARLKSRGLKPLPVFP